ncbi:MAG: RDD family protein [Crocinitomicaceae bacterium]|nr:RDD family protein [Crocinitomicaceae bacterium]
MRGTIHKITENKTFYNRDRDAFGNVTVEDYEKAIPRKIQLVAGLPRFGHYIIDAVIIGLLFIIVDFFLLAGLNIRDSIGFEVNGITYNLTPAFEYIIIKVGYYFICEITTQRTIGKLATNSIVINEYAEAPKSGSLIVRSFIRLIPFEAFSCFSDRGWHDRWSKTYVVTTIERDTLKKLLNEQQGVFISERPDILD